MKTFLFLLKKFRSFRISTKMILGYLIVIVCPTLLFSAMLYRQNHHYLVKEYHNQVQKTLDLSTHLLETRLNLVLSSFNYFSSNSSFISYLKEKDSSIADSMYTYLKNINDVFTYIENGNPDINKITVYSTAEQQFYVKGYIEPETSLSLFLSEEEIDLINSNINGVWIWSDNGENADISVDFYRCIFTPSYREKIGILKISVFPDSLFSSLDSFSSVQFHSHFPNFPYVRFENGIMTDLSATSMFSQVNSDSLVKSSNSSSLHGTFQILSSPPQINKLSLLNLLLPLTVAFGFLSVCYYILMNSFTKRILLLSHHIQNTDTEHPKPFFNHTEYHDELSLLIESYNTMVIQINTLLNDVLQAELSKKEAQYYALQAQIKPHFLFNVLENIRMTARYHNDYETEEMVSVLGNYMRYNLSNSTAAIPLLEELTHAKNYLKIYQYRLSGRLKINISVYTEIHSVNCPRYTFQPLLENFFKHGAVNGRDPHIQIEIVDGECLHRPDDVIVKIIDNGCGIRLQKLQEIQEKLRKGEYESNRHVGLSNTNLRLINYFHSPDYALQIESTPDLGTTLTLYLRK